jgi:L-asparagine transporter-like permease
MLSSEWNVLKLNSSKSIINNWSIKLKKWHKLAIFLYVLYSIRVSVRLFRKTEEFFSFDSIETSYKTEYW